MFFFFFSSRRRHTRFDCDWSSDVCSSDLGDIGRPVPRVHVADRHEVGGAGEGKTPPQEPPLLGEPPPGGGFREGSLLVHASSLPAGRARVNSTPPPSGRLRTDSRPSCWSAIREQMESPRPVPPSFVV